MNAISYIDDWRNLEEVEIIDVRSPAEFENDHIPRSINIPILSDTERHEVGLKYKQVNPFKAKIMGASLISKNISSVLMDDVIAGIYSAILVIFLSIFFQ